MEATIRNRYRILGKTPMLKSGRDDPLDALDDHSTRQQIDALGKLGLQHTRLGDKRVFYGWLAVFAALHFIDQHLGEPDYYEGEFIDHAIALGLARSTAYKVRHLHQHRADFIEWGERVARDRQDKKSTKLYPTLNEMIKRHPPPPRNSRRAQPEKMTASEKLAKAEDEADKLATENTKLQRAVQQHADEIAWLKAEHEAGDGMLSTELAEAQAEITRLRKELAQRPPREAPADLSAEEQLAFNLDEILSPCQARPGEPDPPTPPIDPPPSPDDRAPPIDPPPPEPEPPPENLSEAVMDIWTMKDDRTCDNVAATLGQFPIETWNEDNRDRLAEELWNACDPGVWQGDNEDRVFLTELYFEHDPATKLFADEFGVLTVDEKLGLQIVSWQGIWQMMAPHVKAHRKRDDRRRRNDEANAIWPANCQQNAN